MVVALIFFSAKWKLSDNVMKLSLSYWHKMFSKNYCLNKYTFYQLRVSLSFKQFNLQYILKTKILELRYRHEFSINLNSSLLTLNETWGSLLSFWILIRACSNTSIKHCSTYFNTSFCNSSFASTWIFDHDKGVLTAPSKTFLFLFGSSLQT